MCKLMFNGRLAYLVVRKELEVLAIHPGELGAVKNGSALRDAIKREFCLELVQGIDLLLCSLIPSQQAEIVVDGLHHRKQPSHNHPK